MHAFWICLALALRQMEDKPVKMRLHFFHSASWRTKKWSIHLLTLFLFVFFFSCCFFLLLQFVIRVYHSLVYVEEYIGIGIYISLVKTVHQYGVSIQSCTKVRETFRQITQKLWATKTWDLDKFFKNQSFITFHFLGFFPSTVYNLFFSCVTLKTIYRTKKARLILQSGTLRLLPIFPRHGLLFSGVLHTMIRLS